MAKRKLTTQKVTVENDGKSASLKIPVIVGAKTKAWKTFNNKASSMWIDFLDWYTGSPNKRNTVNRIGAAAAKTVRAARKALKK